MNHIKNEPRAKAEVSKKSSGKFLDAMFVETSKGRTENDAVTFTRSGSGLLDFFAQAEAMRKNPNAALDLFKKAYADDKQSAVRILFYLRDVRGGQGERDLFRAGLEWLGTTYPEVFDSIVRHIPEYGRWDDAFFDSLSAINLIERQLRKDEDDPTPSLLAKWLPTINTKNKSTKAKARFFAKQLGLTEIQYRITVRDIRKKIKLVEQDMSANKWNKINYSAVPSQASRIYKNAFKKHDEARYDKFIEKAETGEVKINAGTLYPYQIYKTVHNDYSKTLEALWNQLPDYTDGRNGIVVADVSGSMGGDPISVSVSLALYFAERNKGAFKDHFITFSGHPKLQKIVGANLLDKMTSIDEADWGQNTNLQAVFDLVLSTAIKSGCTQDELPSTIYIISDMEFDSAIYVGYGYPKNPTNFEAIKAKYEDAGYSMPTLVFWNVDARSGKNVPVQKNENNVALVSGFSSSVFKMVLENKTPEQVMLDTINSPRYSQIII